MKEAEAEEGRAQPYNRACLDREERYVQQPRRKSRLGVECAPGGGVRAWGWSVRLGMECAPGGGVCVWGWCARLGMECASGNGVCAWEWCARLGMECASGNGVRMGSGFNYGRTPPGRVLPRGESRGGRNSASSRGPWLMISCLTASCQRCASSS